MKLTTNVLTNPNPNPEANEDMSATGSTSDASCNLEEILTLTLMDRNETMTMKMMVTDDDGWWMMDDDDNDDEDGDDDYESEGLHLQTFYAADVDSCIIPMKTQELIRLFPCLQMATTVHHLVFIKEWCV